MSLEFVGVLLVASFLASHLTTIILDSVNVALCSLVKSAYPHDLPVMPLNYTQESCYTLYNSFLYALILQLLQVCT